MPAERFVKLVGVMGRLQIPHRVQQCVRLRLVSHHVRNAPFECGTAMLNERDAQYWSLAGASHTRTRPGTVSADAD